MLKQKHLGIVAKLEYEEPSKKEIKENIRQGHRELQVVEEGKLRTRYAKEFVNEL